MDIEIVPYALATHGKFVLNAAMEAADKWPHQLTRDPRTKYHLAELVRRATIAGRAVVAVVPEDHDMFVGFLASPAPQTIAYAYVKYACRRMRVASRLAEAVGIDLARPCALEIWTPAASRIAAKGYHLYPAIPREDHEQARQHSRPEGPEAT